MHLKIFSKIKNLTYICCILICCIVYVDELFAGGEGNLGSLSTGALSGGVGGGGIDSSTIVLGVGYRISLVDKNGNRISNTKSVDYWEEPTDNKGFFNNVSGYSLLRLDERIIKKSTLNDLKEINTCTYDFKQTKQELNKRANLVDLMSINCTEEDGMIVRYDSVYENRANFDSNNKNAYDYPFKPSKPRNGYIAYAQSQSGTIDAGNRFTEFFANNLLNDFFLKNDEIKDWTSFNKFLINCGYNKNENSEQNVKMATSEGIIIQIEPVEAILIVPEGSGKSYIKKRIYIGTISELFRMWQDLKWTSPYQQFVHAWEDGTGGYKNYTYLNPIIYAQQNDNDKKNNVIKKAGIFLADSNGISLNPSAKLPIDGISEGSERCLLKSDGECIRNLYKYLNFINKDKYNALGVALFRLYDYIEDGCDENAKKYISNYKTNHNREEYLKALGSDNETKRCMKIEMNGAIPVYTVKDECNVLNPENVDLFDNGYDSSVKNNVCTKYSNNSCQLKANAIYNSYYNSNRTKYESEIEKLQKQYPNNNLLVTSLWQFFEKSGPTCEKKDIHCEVTQNVVGNCSDNGIKFSDSSKEMSGKACYLSGVAYNIENDIQTSKDDSFSSSTCTVYCKETVDFSLPGSPSGLKGKDVAAGTVLKWGVTGKDDSKFGEMIVTRTCHATGTSCKLGNPMNWTDKIGTKVSVYFKESNGSVINHELKTNLSEVKFNGNLPTSTSSNLSSTSCNSFNGCKNIMNNGGDFTLSAKFTFNYGNDAHNYSDKSTADGKVLTNVSSDAKYIDIGYGFPIKFTNRAYRYDIYDTANNKYLWGALDTMRGYLYASIKNIGTKVTGGYHFDKIIKVTSLLDNSYVVSGNEHSVRYSCPFATTNPLMDAECFDKNGNKYPAGSPYCEDGGKPKGLDVVFRTVQLINKKVYETGNTSAIEDELNKAFPGRAGKGRYTDKDKNDNRIVGTNWLTIDSNEANNTKRIFDILSNMVYAQQPAYHIVLDTTKINYIRKNNKTYRSIMLDPYTDNQRFKFDKTGANIYAYGASDFITDLINKNWLDGVCASGDTDARAERGACRQS